MKRKFFLLPISLILVFTSACSNNKSEESAEVKKYKTCLENETGLLLDETGSNFESARAAAKEKCASVKPEGYLE